MKVQATINEKEGGWWQVPLEKKKVQSGRGSAEAPVRLWGCEMDRSVALYEYVSGHCGKHQGEKGKGKKRGSRAVLVQGKRQDLSLEKKTHEPSLIGPHVKRIQFKAAGCTRITENSKG